MEQVKKGDLSYIGRTVTVTMDRPIGAEHPKHPGLIYPINYGYIENLLGGDGEEQDVYLLGVDKPVDSAECVIIASIMRQNDNEDKWVAVPKELYGSELCCECNIIHETYFQEKYYTSEIYALFEKTCGAVLYCGKGSDRRYFLIKNNSGHIGFPKGHIEYGEAEIDTALREVFEECGLKVRLNSDFRTEYTFTTLENTIKTSVFFLAEFNPEDEVLIQQEEVIGDWLLSYKDAMEKLNWKQDKEILKQAEEFLSAKDQI